MPNKFNHIVDRICHMVNIGCYMVDSIYHMQCLEHIYGRHSKISDLFSINLFFNLFIFNQPDPNIMSLADGRIILPSAMLSDINLLMVEHDLPNVRSCLTCTVLR